jgi:hypothetical protein
MSNGNTEWSDQHIAADSLRQLTYLRAFQPIGSICLVSDRNEHPRKIHRFCFASTYTPTRYTTPTKVKRSLSILAHSNQAPETRRAHTSASATHVCLQPASQKASQPHMLEQGYAGETSDLRRCTCASTRLHTCTAANSASPSNGRCRL